MHKDVVDLELEKLLGEEEHVSHDAEDRPRPLHEIGPKQQHRDHHDPALVVHLTWYALTEPQLTNYQTQTQTRIGTVETAGGLKLWEPQLKNEANCSRKELAPEVYMSGASLPNVRTLGIWHGDAAPP